jgi:putative N6-adenine-specific DNA methylase
MAPAQHPLDGARELFASCPRGLEPALAAELTALGIRELRPNSGGVQFRASLRQAWAVNLHLRIASRVLLRIAQAAYRHEEDLYRLAGGCPWESWFSADSTLRVDVSAQRSPVASLNFVTLRIKDAIVDRFRDLQGRRPSIDTRNPDVRVQAFLDARQATLYLDLSGESLFKRGWRAGRDDKGAAPLKENLAAGLVALAGWQPELPLYDPFCGSGTVLIEAAQQALAIAPGASRSFGFERLKVFDALAWAELRRAAAQRAAERLAAWRSGALRLDIAGSDIDPEAVERSRRNLERAGIPADLVGLMVADLASAQYRPPALAALAGPQGQTRTGMIISNPPYDERVALVGGEDGADGGGDRRGTEDRPVHGAGPDHAELLGRCGEQLKRHFPGWPLHLLSTDPQLPRQLRMQPSRRTPLFNGALECRLLRFDIHPRAPQ